ncbi:MAG TPA: hypothetical protein VH482_15850 [Thermomicrobiales bacterium]|jgi:hypothetical protein
MQIGGDVVRERARWSGCGLLVGLFIGLIVGWMLHSVIGVIVRVGVVLLFVLPFVAALIFLWSSRRAGTESSSVQEATWRDVDDRSTGGV